MRALAFLVMIGLAQAQSPEQVIAKALPSGWVIVERKGNEIPWGHHWCEDYKGTSGTKFVVRGPASARSRFRDATGAWNDVVVGAEALEVWVMPGTYEEGWRNYLCFHRPIQPDVIAVGHKLKVYARPAAHQTTDEQRLFKEHLEKATAVESPESPWNDPKRISWTSWQSDIRGALASEIRK